MVRASQRSRPVERLPSHHINPDHELFRGFEKLYKSDTGSREPRGLLAFQQILVCDRVLCHSQGGVIDYSDPDVGLDS